jgi:glycosyltransferase involved in cell wall biosynthesis
MSLVSIIIAGRCEAYFQQTIDSILDAAVGEIEIIAVVDGYVPNPPLVARDERVRIFQLDKSIGQRAGYNFGVRKSRGKYVMKLDAHAMVSTGFDVQLASHCPDDAIILPEMRKLDVHTWKPKRRGKVHFMHFGLDLYTHFWPNYRKREGVKDQLYPEVMTGQGSCWFTTRKWNDYIGMLDERVGSWGNVGIEVSLRTWLCGGTQILNKDAWQAHWFRRDEGGYTYPMGGRDVAKAHQFVWDNYYFQDNAFEHQVRPFSWLIEKFAPVPGWEAYMSDYYKAPRVIVYYTDNKIPDNLANPVRKRLKQTVGPIPIICVSQEATNFGQNICIGAQPRKYKSIYEAALKGVKAAEPGSVVYLCEHDVFYHPSHFAQLPQDDKTLYFNLERYYYNAGRDSFMKARGKRALSQCVARREALIQHLEERLRNCGDEITEKFAEWEKGSDIKCENFESARPNVDVLHDGNYTPAGRYAREYKKGIKQGVFNLPGWGSPGHFQSITGYKDPSPPKTDPVACLLHKFRRWLPQEWPARIPRYKRKSLAKMYKSLGYREGAEIGVREGKFSQQICVMNNKVHLNCIDVWGSQSKYNLEEGERFLAEAKRRLAPYNTTIIRKPSMDAARDFEDGSLDFVYIDADHSFDFVMQDLIEWSKKVRSGGMVSGHDYYRGRGLGVVSAVDAYTKAHLIEPWFVCDEKEASFFWIKP